MSRRADAAQDLLRSSIFVLQRLQDASNAISAVPCLGAVVGASLALLKTIEKVNGTRTSGRRLAQRATDLIQHIEQTVAKDPESLDVDLMENLSSLLETIEGIRSAIKTQHKHRFLSRLLRHASMSDALDDHTETLDRAWRSFDTCCLISIRQKMTRQTQYAQIQALYDDQQYRLFRMSDLHLREVRGHWHLNHLGFGEEWRGDWQGRTVAVRIVHDDSSMRDDLSTLVRSIPRVHHPYVAQVLGYSHPAFPQRFYVMEIGSVPLSRCLSTNDKRTRLCSWLDMMLGYEAARSATSSPKVISRQHHCLTERCLPNAGIDGDGKIVLTIEDLNSSSHECWLNSYDGDAREASVAPGVWFHDITIMNAAPSSMRYDRRLRRDTCGLGMHVVPWFGRFYDGSLALGDFGYETITRFGELEFVRLGNILELTDSQNSTGAIWELGSVVVNGVIELQPGIMRYMARCTHTYSEYQRTLSLKPEYHSEFWDCREEIAKRYNVATEDLEIVADIRVEARMVHVNQPSSSFQCFARRIPQIGNVSSVIPCGDSTSEDFTGRDLFFHVTVSDEALVYGNILSPWGYWSSDPRPCGGPWPELSIAGLALSQRRMSRYFRLPDLEADLVTRFQLREYG